MVKKDDDGENCGGGRKYKGAVFYTKRTCESISQRNTMAGDINIILMRHQKPSGPRSVLVAQRAHPA